MVVKSSLILPILAVAGTLGAAHAQDAALAAKGKALFRQCAACHTASEGAKAMIGPNLWGVYGRPSATFAGFNYSAAMKRADLVWDDETLDAYLKQPQAKVPQNRMAFAGFRNPADRAAVIAYLKTLKSAEEAAPSDEDAASSQSQ